MSMKKYNRIKSMSSKFAFQPNGDIPYYKLKELADEGITEFKALGFYINTKSKFGPSAVAYNADMQVNLPSHWVEDLKALVEDEAFISDVDNGLAILKLTEWKSERFGTLFDVEFK